MKVPSNARRKVGVPIGLLALAVLGAGLIAHAHNKQTSIPTSNTSINLVDQKTLQGLPHKSASSADVSHLVSGIVPPTNMWLSGMVLQKVPQPVYPMPESFLARENGFEIGLPSVRSTQTEIFGQHTPGLTADLGATSFQLTYYDKLSATLRYTKSGKALGDLTVTEGSPFVFYKAVATNAVQLSDVNPTDILEHNAHYVRYTRAGHTYAVATEQNSINISSSGVTVNLQPGQMLTTYALPGKDDPLRSMANTTISKVSVGQAKTAGEVQTNFSLKTSSGKPTAFATMPYQQASGKSIAEYESIWGTLAVRQGTDFTTTVPDIAPDAELNLSTLSESHKQQLIAALPADVAATKIDAQDSYFAGKQVARAANLLSIAEQLDRQTEASQLKSILQEAFKSRFGTGYFYYDTKLRGIAASTAAFGSEDFNDHHFHYGYWLYAGSIMAKYDNAFIANYGKSLNLLAADIASYASSTQFPLQRNYDPYAGHSWAAGLSPFADGNNQESSSEAIHAWNGVSLWGQATHNSALDQTGRWMLANEANTAQHAWRSVDTSAKQLQAYTSPVSSLNFGGKRTYATFFSAEPSAKLGIQLIPMDPAMTSFAKDDVTIKRVVAASISQDNYNVPLGDYILMYLSLKDSQTATEMLPKQTAIDDGNSKTYMSAFVFSQSGSLHK